MATYTDYANDALDLLGKTNIITNVLTEQSNEALRIKRIYEAERDRLLRAYPWRFARRVNALAPLGSNDRSSVWNAAYQAPNDMLKLRTIIPAVEIDPSDTTPNPYEFQSDTIYTNTDPAYADYTKAITDSALFPPDFGIAYAAALAQRVCMPLTRNLKLFSQLLSYSRQMFIIACTADANEGNDTTDATSSIIASRD